MENQNVKLDKMVDGDGKLLEMLLVNCPKCERAIALKAVAGKKSCPNCNEEMMIVEEPVIITELKALLEKHRDTTPWYVILEFEELIEKIEEIWKKGE